MKKITPKRIQEIIDDLGYCFSTLEAQHFSALLKAKNIDEACKMLLEHISAQEADAVINHIQSENDKQVVLTEIMVKDITKKHEGKPYLFKVGLSLHQSSIYCRKGELYFYANSENEPIANAQQVWKIEYVEAKKTVKENDAEKPVTMPNTIYNTVFPKKKISAGLVEFINVYDYRYYMIAVDGVIIDQTHKDDYSKTALKKKFIKECCKASGVDEANLQFVEIEWEDFADKITSDYDANDFMNYQAFVDFLNQHKMSEECITYLAKGVDDLQDKIG